MSYFGAKDYGLEISKGNVPGTTYVNKFGENPEITTASDPEDVWDGGGIYNWSPSAETYYISSSDATDTQDIMVFLLTEDGSGDWNEETIIVTLQGQTKVEITQTTDTPIRLYRMINRGTTDIAGIVYVYADSTVTAGVPDVATTIRGQIVNGNNQTLMTVYTVPSGKTGYFCQGYVAIGKGGGATAKGASFSWRARLFGEVFAVKGKIECVNTGSGWWKYKYCVPESVPEKTDIIIRCDQVTATSAVYAGMDIILVDN